jgi:hypothetical protein
MPKNNELERLLEGGLPCSGPFCSHEILDDHYVVDKIFLNEVFEAGAKAERAKLREVLKSLEKEIHILEDGVPVETYGYEETYNQALSDISNSLKD